MKIFFLLLLIFACDKKSGTDTKPRTELDDFNSSWTHQNTACWELQKNMESVQVAGPDQKVIFDPLESRALASIEKFNIEHTDLTRRLDYKKLYFKLCKTEIVPNGKHYACPSTDMLSLYFKLLLQGIEKKNWSELTRQHGLKLTTSFIKRQLFARGEVETVTMLIELFDQLNQMKLLKKNHGTTFQKLKEEWKIFCPPKTYSMKDVTCKNGLAIIESDEKKVTEFMAKLQKFESDLP